MEIDIRHLKWKAFIFYSALRLLPMMEGKPSYDGDINKGKER